MNTEVYLHPVAAALLGLPGDRLADRIGVSFGAATTFAVEIMDV